DSCSGARIEDQNLGAGDGQNSPIGRPRNDRRGVRSVEQRANVDAFAVVFFDARRTLDVQRPADEARAARVRYPRAFVHGPSKVPVSSDVATGKVVPREQEPTVDEAQTVTYSREHAIDASDQERIVAGSSRCGDGDRRSSGDAPTERDAVEMFGRGIEDED